MLVAYNEVGNIVFSEQVNTKIVRQYYCPACLGRVVFRKGNKTIPHFAHKQKAGCDLNCESESRNHMQGKIDLFNILQKRVKVCYLERYFPRIRQRADIFIKYDNINYALEFQCSILNSETLVSRTEGYKRLNVQVLWIFNQELLQGYGSYKWKLKTFIQESMFTAPVIFTYDPKRKIVANLSQVTPFSKTYFFSNIITIPLAKFTPNFWKINIQSKPDFLANWLRHRNFCCQKPIYNYNLRTPFYKKLYSLNLTLAALPIFVGVPLPSSWIIITPVIEWQGHIYLYLRNFCRRQMGVAVISEYKLWCMLRYLYKSGNIVIRKQVKHVKKELVKLLTEFVNVLIFVKFLVKSNEGNKYYIKLGAIIEEENVYQYLTTLFTKK